MKSSTFALTLVLCSTLSHSDAFAILSGGHVSTTRHTFTSLDATSNKGAALATAVALGWGIATATIMTPSVAFAADDYVDFSLPSYKAALSSPVNASMKGDTMLMATPFGGAVRTDGTQAVKAAPTSQKTAVLEPTKEDAADAKAEAKARQKEARARQMAAVDAALANKE